MPRTRRRRGRHQDTGTEKNLLESCLTTFERIWLTWHASCNWTDTQYKEADAWYYRNAFKKYCSYSLPDERTITSLANAGPLVELGAGTGYWTWLINMAGGNCIATDPSGKTPSNNEWFPRGTRAWTKAEKLTAYEALFKYPDRNALMVWPCYSDSWFWALDKPVPQSAIYYVGEREGGCCLSTDDFVTLDKLGLKLKHLQHMPITTQSHGSLQDSFWVFQNKSYR